MESKIIEFGSRFAEKSMSELSREIRIDKGEKNEIKNTIDSIYNSKLKSNVI